MKINVLWFLERLVYACIMVFLLYANNQLNNKINNLSLILKTNNINTEIIQYKIQREYYIDLIIKLAFKENRRANYFKVDLSAKTLYDFGYEICGLPINEMVAIYSTESDWEYTLVSCKGAVGLAQLMPSTAMTIAKNLGYGHFSRDYLTDPVHSVKFSCALIRYLKIKYNGNMLYVLTAYGIGENKTDYLIKTYRTIPKEYREYYYTVQKEKKRIDLWTKEFIKQRKLKGTIY